jgi:hypothetical protein
MLSARSVSSAELLADTDLRLFLRSKSKGMLELLRLDIVAPKIWIPLVISWIWSFSDEG